MSFLTHCDYCTKQWPPRQPPTAEITAQVHGRTFHFCSRGHLAQWAIDACASEFESRNTLTLASHATATVDALEWARAYAAEGPK